MKRKNQRQKPEDDAALVAILNRQRAVRLDTRGLADFSSRVLNHIGETSSRVTIVFVSDRAIRGLNRSHRGLDKATDVLSFPFQPDFPHEAEPVKYLGDVMISTETAARYAAKLRIPVDREVSNLVIHGLLHLCGYDHETDNGEMQQLERRLRRRLLGS
jgi:probable rRNA maturation factor